MPAADANGPSAGRETSSHPTVFISSTAEDLRAYRFAARDAALSAGFFPAMMEYWTASANRPLAECLARVDAAELLVVIVARRSPGGRQLSGRVGRCSAEPNYDHEARDSESPVYKVHLPAYRIGRSPVTVAEYREFIEHDGYQDEEHWQAGGFGQFQEPAGWQEQTQHPNRPVVGVSWFEASAYAAWAKCRLPTEAQWERARGHCRFRARRPILTLAFRRAGSGIRLVESFVREEAVVLVLSRLRRCSCS